MVDPRATFELAPALPAPPEALVQETWILHSPGPGERSGVMRPDAAAIVDGLLTRVARGHGALDVAIGEQLDALSVGDHFLRLGYSNLGDYARERLGVSPTTARSLAKLARELRARPLLREAVRSGEISARKAQAVLPVARGDDEAAWGARARAETVRALEVAVREARCGGGPAAGAGRRRARRSERRDRGRAGDLGGAHGRAGRRGRHDRGGEGGCGGAIGRRRRGALGARPPGHGAGGPREARPRPGARRAGPRRGRDAMAAARGDL